MKILNLFSQGPVYTSNVYLITGDWNAIPDCNTLIDVGRDPAIIERILAASTGVGKKRVEQVVLTHSHYDHTSLLEKIREQFNPTILAASASLPGVDVVLRGGELLRCGDGTCEVFATPGHSNDSVCLYCAEKKALFVGDTPVIIRSADASYPEEFIRALETLGSRDVETIFFGHGPPLTGDCNEIMKASLENVRTNAPKIPDSRPHREPS